MLPVILWQHDSHAESSLANSFLLSGKKICQTNRSVPERYTKDHLPFRKVHIIVLFI